MFLSRVSRSHVVFARSFSTSSSSSAFTSSSSPSLKIAKLVYHGHPTLLTPAKPVSNEEIQALKQSSSPSPLRQRLATLALTQHRHDGYGIAAPQIGWNARVFSMGSTHIKHIVQEVAGLPLSSYTSTHPDPPFDPVLLNIPFMLWINPSIIDINTIISTSTETSTETSTSTSTSNETSTPPKTCWYWEGCLSIPGVLGWVPRPDKIGVHGWDFHGREHRLILSGLAARIFQHEFDHLNGILFPSRIAHADHLLPRTSLLEQARWLKGWPAPGAHKTNPGEFSDVE